MRGRIEFAVRVALATTGVDDPPCPPLARGGGLVGRLAVVGGAGTSAEGLWAGGRWLAGLRGFVLRGLKNFG